MERFNKGITMSLPWNGLKNTIDAWRQPTAYELKFGYGAIHWKTFDISEWLKPDGTLKRWIKCNYDGLRYYR